MEMISIEPLCTNNCLEIQRIVSIEEVARNCNIPYPYPKNGAIKWINKAIDEWQKKSAFKFGIKINNITIGYVGIVRIDKNKSIGKVDYFLHPEYWNKGYTSEAVRRVIDYGFNVINLDMLKSKCLKENIGSIKVLLKNNFIIQNEIIDSGEYNSKFKGKTWIEFKLTKSQWKFPTAYNS